MIPRLCYQNRITDREATPCSVERLRTLLYSHEVQDICDRIKLLDQEYPNGGDERDEELARLKKQLPVVMFHAQRFTDNERKNAKAVPSGLAMLDVDDVQAPNELFYNLTEDDITTHRIVFAAVTPSGHGLRLVAERREGESISDTQLRLATVLQLQQYDTSTKDLARASFVMPMSYVLYMDDSALSFPSQEEADRVAEAFPIVETNDAVVRGVRKDSLEQTSGGAHSAGDICGMTTFRTDDQTVSLSYKGLPYSEIVEQLIAVLGGTPVQGERNNLYFSLVRYIRYICDFNPEQIFQVLPSFNLSEAERRGEIARSNATPRRATPPDELLRAIALAEVNHESTADEEETQASDNASQDSTCNLLPKLPRVLELICRHLPESFHPAMIIAALPVLGTLATRVRFKYLDHATHSFSFFSMITAPAATGKSFIRTPVNLLLTPIDERDEDERAKQMAYEEERRKCKNSKRQPEDPHACPRNNGVTISIAKLLQLMTYAEGKHLLGVGEEIDTLLKSENAGAWSKKGDIYRLAFDNASYSQQYMSDNSFSTKVDVYYNILITGTPNGMYRFFKDVEDGLVTRVAFAQLPDMRYTRMPEFVPFTDREQQQIIESARYLDEQEGNLYCPAVNKAIDQWLEQKRIAADQAQSSAMDTLRRRAAVIGFRAGYLATLMFDEKTKQATTSGDRTITGLTAKRSADFAVWVAEYVFQQQMALFADKFEAVTQQQDEHLKTNQGAVKSLLSQLPTDFQRADLINLRAKNHQSTQVKVVLSRWIKAGYITRNANGSYHKVAAQCV